MPLMPPVRQCYSLIASTPQLPEELETLWRLLKCSESHHKYIFQFTYTQETKYSNWYSGTPPSRVP